MVFLHSLWLSPHPLALESLSCPMQKFLLRISSLFLGEVGLPQPVLSLVPCPHSPPQGISRFLFPHVTNIISPVWWGGWHLQMSVYLQSLLFSRPSGDTSCSQAFSEKNIFNPSSLPLVFPRQIPLGTRWTRSFSLTQSLVAAEKSLALLSEINSLHVFFLSLPSFFPLHFHTKSQLSGQQGEVWSLFEF